MNKAVRTISLLMFICIFGCSIVFQPTNVEAFSNQIIQQGATGDDVVELQARLQYIGFYHGTIDGVYGWGTYWAVRKFQEQFGLTIDGLVGSEMKAILKKNTNYDYKWVHKQFYEGRKFTYYGATPKELQTGPKGSRSPQKEPAKRSQQGKAPTPWKQPTTGKTPTQGGTPTPGPVKTPPTTPVPAEEPVKGEKKQEKADIHEAINVPAGFSQNDIRMMAQAVYGEARGEPYIGQVAVAAVILNRVKSPSFPNTPSGVIFEPRAFTAVADGQIWLDPDETARRAVLDAINGQDPSGNALYYFNPSTATSGWIWSRPQVRKIGKHIFCK